ncbi:uncharacterized protein LOC127080877 [Lathyrus oleraceus]|uniref:uncharacterized protein LOC127080877 n=1 Tax=Pisum sativum TaxID=3888 RepID=UPI0021CFF9CF|nr:uncharacterized protein LOC127080877 [Pisum sativum]
MTKLFLNTLSPFYYERIVVSAPSDYTEMVNMGMRLEEGVCEGQLKESGSSRSSKRYGNFLSKKKVHDANAISHEMHMRSPRSNQRQQHVASVTLIINPAPVVQVTPNYQPRFQQRTHQQNHQQNRVQRQAQFDPILMSYAELYPALIQNNFVQTRTPPSIPKELPWWYKFDHHCAFHQTSPGHDIENCLALKVEVKRLVQRNILSFEHYGPNVQANPLRKNGGATVNMVEGCPGNYCVFNVNLIRRSLVEMHGTLCELSYYENDHVSCCIWSRNPRGCSVVKRDLEEMLDGNLIQITRDRDEDEHGVNVIVPHFSIPELVMVAYNSQNSAASPLVIRLEGPAPYESNKVVPYK